MRQKVSTLERNWLAFLPLRRKAQRKSLSLESIRLVLEPLLRQVEHTQQAVGTDAMEASLEVYASLKRSSKDNRAKTYLEPMQVRFSRTKSSSSSG